MITKTNYFTQTQGKSQQDSHGVAANYSSMAAGKRPLSKLGQSSRQP